MIRKVYPTDVSDEEWVFFAPYLTLLREDAAQRVYPLREIFDVARWMVKAGCPWRMLPNDLPPWTAVQQPAVLRVAVLADALAGAPGANVDDGGRKHP